MAKETLDMARRWPEFDPLDDCDEDGHPQETEADVTEPDTKRRQRKRRDTSETTGEP